MVCEGKNPSCCAPIAHPAGVRLGCRNCNTEIADISTGCKLCENCGNILKRCRHCMRPRS
jgi:hypothetical protein